MSELPSAALRYLRQLRAGLSTLSEPEKADIVSEVESHFRDKLARGERDVTAGFDPPVDYARQFLEEKALTHAVATGSPYALGRALLGGAGNVMETLLVAVPLALVQVIGVLTLVIGLIRPFYASHTGMFTNDAGHVALVGIGRTDGLHDVLGIWTTPVFIGTSALVLFFARRASLALAKRRLAHSRTR